MLDDTSQALLDWAVDVTGLPDPTLSLLDSPAETPRVSIVLLDFAEHPPLRGNGRTPLQFFARYLVTVSAPEPQQAHRALGDLIFAALESSTYEVDLQPIDTAYWAASGLSPQPAFALRVPVRRTRAETLAPQVREPISIQAAPLRVIEGVVTAPGDVPIPGARVEILSSGASPASTDRSGRFQMTIGDLKDDQTVRISAKNHSMTTTLGDAIDSDGVFRLRFDPSEQSEQ